jgi:hypothetical protein
MLEGNFHFKIHLFAIANAKISIRFGVPLEERLQLRGEAVLICLKLFLKNFKLHYVFARKHCPCHQQGMTCQKIFSHEGLDFGRWLINC